MKKEIVNRIKQLGGNVANVKGVSLQRDLCAITFNTALYRKPEDTPWHSAEDTEPIEGLGDWWMRIWNCSILTKIHFIRKWLIPTIHWTKNLVGNYFG